MATKNRQDAQRGPEDQGKPDAVGHGTTATNANAAAPAGGPAAEPELSVAADYLTLAEPVLAPAAVSRSAAEAVDLDETAAEAQAVAKEAEDAGTLVSGPLPATAPTVKAAPSGTAPAGGPAGDAAGSPKGGAPRSGGSGEGAPTGSSTPDSPRGAGPAQETAPAGPTGKRPIGKPPTGNAGAVRSAATAEDPGTAGADDAGADDAADPQRAAAPVAVGAGAAHGLLAGTDPAALGMDSAAAHPAARAGATAIRTSPGAVAEVEGAAAGAPRPSWAPAGDTGKPLGPRRARSRERREKAPRPVALLVLGGLVVLALLVWAAVSLVRGLTGAGDPQSPEDVPTEAGADGVIAEDVPPSVLTAGHCLLDFTDIESDVTIVTCSTPHGAQLIASEFYPEEAKFPGRDQLGARADAACDTAPINSGVAASAGRIDLLRVTPTEGTWADGDRRVDCFAVLRDGATLSRSLLTE
ncbi:septum formation family protein [Arthrobacter sp. TMN-37]